MDSENGAEGAQRNEAGGDAEPARGSGTSADRQRRAGAAGTAHGNDGRADAAHGNDDPAGTAPGNDNPADTTHRTDGRASAPRESDSRTSTAVEIESLVKRYGELIAVDGLSLRIGRGEVVGLLGPNGSGKTTTINCLLQLLSYDKGAIRVFGEPMSPTAYGLKRRIGVVPQEVAVFDELTVAENVDAFCALYVRDRGLRRRMVSEAIAFVGLEKFAAFKPKKLSGGLLRRLNIACGIAHRPDLIILDEPTVAVDPQSRSAILDGIKRLNQEGATVIYTSHYMEEVEQLCDRITIMDRGRQVASGTSDELKAMIGTGERIRVEVVDPLPLGEDALEALRRLERVRSVAYEAPTALIECAAGPHNLSDVMGALAGVGATCGRVVSEPPTLNEVFLEITGRALRDEAA
ncbi:ABC transporter ATP-binding protein [Schaalia sp. HMT-877]|nr:ABC transporter ATP-binding protein [Schaalia sp. HMT-877]